MKRLRVGLLCVLLPLAIATPAAAQQATLVPVAGRQVEVVRMGDGSPTLVLESGGGEAASQWAGILPDLARQTRVIAYSRAGFGKSSPSTLPGSPQLSVTELHQLLQALGESGPFVLAGHSWGGLLVRLYASTFPTEVAGLVLIDATHEAQVARYEAMKPGFSFAAEVRKMLAKAPPAVRDVYEQAIRVGVEQKVDGMTPMRDLPLAVITAVKPCPPQVSWTCSDPAVWPMWRHLHSEWSERSTASLHIVSARTEHYVMNDQPSLIVDAVKFVLDQVRTTKP
jgi:pimeloyl-ACP methyl ester carboxylesterase